MDIYVYSDESGVFDRVHNRHFVYGGLILLGAEQKREAENKYRAAERSLRASGGYPHGQELKATALKNAEKGKLFRSMNHFVKFGVVVEQWRVFPRIFSDTKSKQRYLDYVYKIGLKHAIGTLIETGAVSRADIRRIFILADEHATATDGKYELRESLRKEFKEGMYNSNFTSFVEPMIPDMEDISVRFLDSSVTPLIRAADIIANRIYYHAEHDLLAQYKQRNNTITVVQP